MIPQQETQKALIERAKVTARILRVTADRETTNGEVPDPPSITWAELNELATLMRDSAEVIEALSSSSGSSEKPLLHQRAWDLLRQMRSELLDAELISREEYAWLLAEAPGAADGPG